VLFILSVLALVLVLVAYRSIGIQLKIDVRS
jgi:hypothetical protein